MYPFKSEVGLDFLEKQDREEIILMLSLLQEVSRGTDQTATRRNYNFGR